MWHRFSFSCVLFVALATSSSGAFVLEDFESGSFEADWTITGTGVGDVSWIVGGETGTGVVNIEPLPPDNDFFARSGEPNRKPPDSSGRPLESDVGVLTSPKYSVGYTTLEWIAAGWSGRTPSTNPENYFQILNHAFVEVEKIVAPHSDAWTPLSVNLIDIGLSPGAMFYFRAVDGRNADDYGWIAIDNLQFTGDALAVVPEAGNFLSCALLVGLALTYIGSKCVSRGFSRKDGELAT